jgi:hypothetical protein
VLDVKKGTMDLAIKLGRSGRADLRYIPSDGNVDSSGRETLYGYRYYRYNLIYLVCKGQIGEIYRAKPGIVVD